MLFLYIIILALTLWGIRRRLEPSDEAALSVRQATMIKGIFVLLVFVSHVSQYLDLNASTGFLTRSYVILRSNIGQLVVVPFLFYSGYGIRCSIERKRTAYVRAILTRRVPRVYLHTFIMVVLFLVISLLLGSSYTWEQILAGFLLWGSFGNSNWYIFAILLLYLFTWFSFSVFKSTRAALTCCCALTILYCFVLSRFGPSRFYDTVLVYCFGLLYPTLTPLIRKTLGQCFWRRICFILPLCAAILVLTRGIYGIPNAIQENTRSLLVMLLMNLLLEWVEVGNLILQWFGTHVYECYMLQRIPMILLHHFGVNERSVPLFICASFVGTVLLALLFSKLMERRDRLAFCSKPSATA